MLEQYYQTWAHYFQLAPTAWLQPGTTLKPEPNYTTDDFVLLWRVGQRTIVQLAPDYVADVQHSLDQLPSQHRLRASDLPAGETMINKMYFLDSKTFRPVGPPASFMIRALMETDRTAFATFQAQSTDEERDEGDVDIGHLTAFGAFDGERLAAVASTYLWRGFIDIGVLVASPYRGQGLGRAVVSACAMHHLTDDKVVVYRHDIKNVGSQRIAEGLNFTPTFDLEGVKWPADGLRASPS
jgi:GNAT superfamily N-acetyltransferase